MFHCEELSGVRTITVNGVVDTIKSRNKNRADNELAYRFIREQFIRYGWQVDSLTFGTTGKNIYAILPGALYPNDPVLLTAHYDGMPNVAVAPAADDNGSGTAAVIEAARVLKDYQFEHTVMLVVFDEEEYGLAGSYNFAHTWRTNNDSIYGVINMDAIAHDSDNDSVARVHTRPTANSEFISDTVVAVNAGYNIGLDLQVNNPGATYSDHASFWNENYGAVLMIQDWDNDANPHYHTVTDQVTYFNIPYYHKLARLSIGSAAAFAIPYAMPAGMGIEEELGELLQVYPNPSSTVVNLKWQLSYTSVQVIDMLGKEVYIAALGQGAQNTWIDVSGFDPGIYFARLANGNQVITKKLIVTQ